MFKIRLLILLLISFIFRVPIIKLIILIKYLATYIGGEFDGLVLKNYLTSSLKI